MSRIMRDSTTIGDIPIAGTSIVAVYSNGKYAVNPISVTARFGKTPVVWIDVLGTNPHADVLDVETGDATPATAVAWVKAKLALPHTYPPVIYCNRGNITAVFNALTGAGYKAGVHFRTWIATLDGTTTVRDMTRVAAIQDRGEAQTGGHFDESIVYDVTWKETLPPPAPEIIGMLVYPSIQHSLAARVVISKDGGKTWT
jgi:hypothetical protein